MDFEEMDFKEIDFKKKTQMDSKKSISRNRF